MNQTLSLLDKINGLLAENAPSKKEAGVVIW